ncbi:MAG: DUF1697 domain-containing protein [bacterium]
MPKYIAFLRAINVGGHTVKMDHLRTLFEALGFSNVETFIASGNVIFDSKSKNTRALEKKIEAFLQASLGYAVVTFIRSTDEVATIAGYEPFKVADPNGDRNVLYIAFLADTPAEEAKKKLLSFATENDELHVSGREVYWRSHKKMSESEFSGARLEKILGMPATLRNSTTIKRLGSKYP